MESSTYEVLTQKGPQVFENEVNITFRGTIGYRERLQREALNRRMKVQALIENAIEAYIDPESIGQPKRNNEWDPALQRFTSVPSAEQPAPPPQSDMLSGLSEADAQAVLKVIQVLRDGPEAFGGLILGGVKAWETWKNDQQTQNVRAVASKEPSRAKAR